jgi:Tfp pilus assembly protein PilX
MVMVMVMVVVILFVHQDLDFEQVYPKISRICFNMSDADTALAAAAAAADAAAAAAANADDELARSILGSMSSDPASQLPGAGADPCAVPFGDCDALCTRTAKKSRDV